MRLLLDANVILEVLLQQRQAGAAAELLENQAEHELYISDFALHAVCLISLRHQAIQVLTQFLNDAIATAALIVIEISSAELIEVLDTVQLLGLDFDDAYQYVLAENEGLSLVSFDQDFDKTPRGRHTPQAILQRTNHPNS
jgi:predicted nucleic acid-binding protein